MFSDPRDLKVARRTKSQQDLKILLHTKSQQDLKVLLHRPDVVFRASEASSE
jgi:hypothetical protein